MQQTIDTEVLVVGAGPVGVSIANLLGHYGVKALVVDRSNDLVIAYSRVSREAREAVYKSVAQLDATTMHTKRVELSEAIRAALQKELDSNDAGAFTVTAVNVRNLLTDPAIEAAIRQRAETDQAIERMRKEVELAKAEAERRVVQAEGEARANQIISASLTPSLKDIKLAEIQRDTALALASKPGNTVLLLARKEATGLVSDRP